MIIVNSFIIISHFLKRDYTLLYYIYNFRKFCKDGLKGQKAPSPGQRHCLIALCKSKQKRRKRKNFGRKNPRSLSRAYGIVAQETVRYNKEYPPE